MKLTLKTDLDLAYDLELVTNRKVLSQSILIRNMKALTLTNQKILANKETNKQIDGLKTKCPLYVNMGAKKYKRVYIKS